MYAKSTRHKAALVVGSVIFFSNGESPLGERFGFVVLAVGHIDSGHSAQRIGGKLLFIVLDGIGALLLLTAQPAKTGRTHSVMNRMVLAVVP